MIKDVVLEEDRAGLVVLRNDRQIEIADGPGAMRLSATHQTRLIEKKPPTGGGLEVLGEDA